jgi:opacity protein-like surface antigen
MRKLGFAASLAFLITAAASADGPDPRERNFKFFVDSVQIDGVVGYRIGFAHTPVTRTDSRQLGLAYSPDQRLLSLTVTQKGLNRLQDWLNGATDTGTPAAKTVTIEADDNQGNLLAKWELTSVTPSTFNSAAAGNINEVDSTLEFIFDRLRLIQANGK